MDIKNYLNRNYRFLGGIEKIELLNRGINSTNWLVFVGKKKYVLKKFTDGSDSEKMEKMCRILDFCKKQGAKVIKPIKRKNGNYVDKKEKTYLTEYKEGKQYRGEAKELKDAARNLAILHRALSRCKITYQYRLNQRYYRHLNRSELNKIKQKILSKKDRDELDKKVLSNIAYLSRRFLVSKDFLSGTKQLVHFDFQPGNLVFNKGKVAVILDLASMRKGFAVEDLAFGAYRFASAKEDRKLFVANYLMYNSIEEKQLHFLKDYFINTVLGRISYILRKRYFAGSDSWSSHFQKWLDFLKLAEKVEG